MNPQLLIQQAAIDGVSLALSETGTLKAIGDTEAVKRWLPVIRQHRPRILATLRPSTSAEHEALIMRWITFIGETDEAAINELLDDCRTNPEALAQCLKLIEETIPPIIEIGEFEDNRRSCKQCLYLTPSDNCRSPDDPPAKTSPFRERPRRCEGYEPKANDPDQRLGRERWQW